MASTSVMPGEHLPFETVTIGTVLSGGGLLGVLGLLIRQYGPWRKQASDERDGDFARLRADIDRQATKLEKLENEVRAANERAVTAHDHATRSDAKLSTALTACELLLGLVERELPTASEIPLVKRLLAQAAADDMGVGAGMRAIATLPATGAKGE